MTPLNNAITELRLAAQQAEQKAAELQPGATHEGALEDHRTEVLGELLDAVDRIEPGLGTRFMAAMYPFSHSTTELVSDAWEHA